MMWYELFKFELRYRAKRAETYVFFIFLFLFSVFGTDFIFQGVELGKVKQNAPLVIAKTMGAISGIFMIMASFIMGVPVLRDYRYQIESLIFINPIKKRDYLIGKFLGSMVVLLFVFSAILWGMSASEFMPWQEENLLLPYRFLSYLKPFVTIVLPIVFFGASLFFVSGSLSKKLLVVYTQGIILFVIFLLTKAIKNEHLQAILDPFSLTTLTAITKNWSVEQRNSLLVPFDGLVAENKLFWLALGVMALIIGYNKFHFSRKKKKNKSSKKPIEPKTLETSVNKVINIPIVKLQYNAQSQCIQLLEHTLFYIKSLLKETSFWAIVLCGMIIILVNSVNLGTSYGVDSYPATYFIVEELQETSIFFFVVILMFYSGELIWKEREAKLDLIFDSSPISNLIHLAGKFVALVCIYVILIVALIISGLLFQAYNGYYNFQFAVYFYGFFLEILPFLVLYTFIAFFFQVIFNRKLLGIIFVMVFFILNIASEFYGFQHSLYKFGGKALGTYSEMNGYGHFLVPYLWLKTYWLVFGIILLIVSSALIVRGTETSFLKRCKQLRSRFDKLSVRLLSALVVLFVSIGGFIFYNTNVLNEYWTINQEEEFRANYEKNLKQFEHIPQPKIVNTNLKLELYPETREYYLEGCYLLQNTQTEPLTEVHVQKLIASDVILKDVTFEGGAAKLDMYDRYNYSIYELKEPLQPGDSLKMNFIQTFTSAGFEDGNGSTKIVRNGTFFNNTDFPSLGYNRKYELKDEELRKNHGLPTRQNKASITDTRNLVNARSGSDSNGTTFEMIIGTSEDQTAVAPGALINSWKQNGRAYFQYEMDRKMINFYSILSARYAVEKQQWQATNAPLNEPVALEIYYHKGHEYNLDRMMKSMRQSLDYFSSNFSAYQYKHLRIMEYPRYAAFAQSLPGTISFSEALGFVFHIRDETDVDMAFYITAHEVAHQWWGMQVEAANVQGQHFILETLAQYSALMVLKKNFPDEKVQQFLKMQLEDYKLGKTKEKELEVPLYLVEGQDYIYYNKGAINMYALQEYIGEQNLNIALQHFIADWRSDGGRIKSCNKRYATSKDLLGYFRKVTPDSLQYVITDLFETTEPIDNYVDR